MRDRELNTDLLVRAYERFERSFAEVTLEELNAFPVADFAPQIKSMGWLAWHTGRELDLQISHLAGKTSLWEGDGWADKLDITVQADEDGWNHSLEQAQAIVIKDKASILAYLKAATDQAIAYLAELTESQLDDIVDTSWTPAVTRGVRLVSIIDDAIMHSGQVFYARRLLGLTD